MTPGVPGKWRLAAFMAALLCFVSALSIPVGYVAANEGESFNWEVAAIFGTALGTTALAAFTGALAFAASGDVRATWELARLSREDQLARDRAIVILRDTRWEESPDPDVSGLAVVRLINIGFGPARDVVLEARISTPDDGVRKKPEPDEFWGGIARVMLPNETFTFRLPVIFHGPTPDWAQYMGYDVRATFTDRTGRRRYDLEGNEVGPEERIIWTPIETPFVGAKEEH